MLIDSPRLTRRDREHWEIMESLDQAYALARAARLRRLERDAVTSLRSFFNAGAGYIGVSWGKDSVVVAHLAHLARVDAPLVAIRAGPLVSPECDQVRDRFIADHPGVEYHEIRVDCQPDPDDRDGWHQTGTLERGFAKAAERFGDRYTSGVRAAESSGRSRRMRAYGCATGRTLAPIGWWRTEDVFAYAHWRGLPLHPAYAMSDGGAMDRARLRVSFLTLRTGEGRGKREWENRYYGDRLAELRAMARRVAG